MEVTLVNCKSKFLTKGIDVNSLNWQASLSSNLLGYLSSFEGWDYDYVSDTLKIKVSGTITVPATIIDFGDGSEVVLG